jgi:hypothetical protein
MRSKAIFNLHSFFFFISITGVVLFTHSTYAQQIRINEVMTSNSETISDQDGDYPDWIELHNFGKSAVNLKGMGISDQQNQPFKWVLPEIYIDAGGYILIFASGKNRWANELHTNFRLTSRGDDLYLFGSNGEELDFFPAKKIPTDISVGRSKDQPTDWVYFDEPTPGAANFHSGYLDLLSPPVFSYPAGFYNHGLEVHITHTDPEVTIYYTLDGSEPGFQSMVYSEPISVKEKDHLPDELALIPTSPIWEHPKEKGRKATVIRAIAMRSGFMDSDVQTSTYFVFPEGANAYSLPVVSISTDSRNFFDDEIGIYVPGNRYNPNSGNSTWQIRNANYRMTGDEWERPVNLEFFDEEGKQGFNLSAGARIHGAFTRAYPSKSLRLYFRNKYDFDNELAYPVFSHQSHLTYKRLLMRNGGNDYFHSIFRDGMMQTLVRDMGFSVQAFRPSVVFLNGEYWGLLNFRERIDKHYLESHFLVNPDKIELLENHRIPKEGDAENYLRFLNFLSRNDLKDEANYKVAEEWVDVENFTRYQVAQIYLGNTDWPGNNIRYWRKNTAGFLPNAPKGHDGRWRWVMYDTDFGFGLGTGNNPSHNTLEFATETHGPHWPNPSWSTFVLRAFLKSENYQKLFINTFADHLNTTFKPDRVVDVVEYFEKLFDPEIEQQINRWNNPGNSKQAWRQEVELIKDFGKKRESHVREHIKEYFKLKGEFDLEVDVSHSSRGYVQVNNISIIPQTSGINEDAYPWKGQYFQDVPITLIAHAYEGYTFSHWTGLSGNPKTPRIEVSAEQELKVKAVFTPSAIPLAYPLAQGSYLFSQWDNKQEAGTFPESMAFVYMNEEDPGLAAQIEGFTSGGFDLSSRTRVNGLGKKGVSFINTASGNEGYPSTKLGGALLAINTTGCHDLAIAFEASSLQQGSRLYALRLQYRIGGQGDFKDVLDRKGNPVQYIAGRDGQSAYFGPVNLPKEIENKAYVQLYWRYYFTGERLHHEHGQRSEIALGKVKIGNQKDFELNLRPFDIAERHYHFTRWPSSALAGAFPPSMGFVYMDQEDPGLEALPEGLTSGDYDLISRTRINGQGDLGFSIINTANEEGNPGYPGTRLGGAILAINTSKIIKGALEFKAGTLNPGSRVYHFRLQYRIGDHGPFKDFPGENGLPIVYNGSSLRGHSMTLGPYDLPDEIIGKENVQLFWRYYYSGERVSQDAGNRSELFVSEIYISGYDEITERKKARLFSNFPNPFYANTTIQYELKEETKVMIVLLDQNGRKVKTILDDYKMPGFYQVDFSGDGLQNGIYFCKLLTSSESEMKRVVLLR